MQKLKGDRNRCHFGDWTKVAGCHFVQNKIWRKSVSDTERSDYWSLSCAVFHILSTCRITTLELLWRNQIAKSLTRWSREMSAHNHIVGICEQCFSWNSTSYGNFTFFQTWFRNSIWKKNAVILKILKISRKHPIRYLSSHSIQRKKHYPSCLTLMLRKDWMAQPQRALIYFPYGNVRLDRISFSGFLLQDRVSFFYSQLHGRNHTFIIDL